MPCKGIPRHDNTLHVGWDTIPRHNDKRHAQGVAYKETMLIQILQIIAAVGTILTGLVSLVKPASVTGFTGLRPEGGRGLTEIRAILGGFFIALGAAPLILNSPVAYLMLGIAYLGVALVRGIFMFVDRSVVQSNVISLAVEIVFGILLVIPA
ncbi:MAG: DUF4345 domain-containing protein [Chloroflexi bacterium]|nr:DUF4345 domain-containing protein [Chloroflexota bacterium]